MLKKVPNYEENYEIDENGNIYSLPRNGTVNYKKKISTRINRHGYEQCSLMKNNKMKTHLVHRLVAICFVDNPNNYPQVNHINGIKSDNRAENLEWCSVSYNTKHAFERNLGGFKDSALKNLSIMNEKQYTKVILEKDEEVLTFNSTLEAGKFLNTDKNNISRAFRKNQKCKGYKVICERTANGEA